MEIAYYENRAFEVVVLEGEDVLDFLQSQATGDLRAGAGLACYDLWLDHRGKLIAAGEVLVLSPTCVWIVVESASVEALLDTFERHIIADDVEVTRKGRDGLRYFALPPAAAQQFASAAGLTVKPRNWARLDAGWAWHGGPFGMEGLQLLVDADSFTLPYGWCAMMPQQAERLQIEAGIPAIPSDIGADSTPLEGPLRRWISFDKGCYLGQEVIQRMDRLGRVPRRLVRFRLPDSEPKVMPGDPVTGASGSQVGTVSRCTVSDNAQIGFAMVKTAALDAPLLVGGQTCLAELL